MRGVPPREREFQDKLCKHTFKIVFAPAPRVCVHSCEKLAIEVEIDRLFDSVVSYSRPLEQGFIKAVIARIFFCDFLVFDDET